MNLCPNLVDLTCLAHPCPGNSDPQICHHLATLSRWRTLSEDEQAVRLSANRPTIDPRVRDAVNSCADRGPVLPISQQDDCDCRGRERSECRAGRGMVPGKVTLRECLACRS